MNSSNIAFAPSLVKSHSSQPSQHHATRRPLVHHRPATSPTLPSPPVPPKDTAINRVLKETASAEHRWSEVVPPATALTFAAIWDPEDGLVTFSGAALSTSENGGSSISPEDADSRSQVLTVDFLNTGTAPNTAKDSLFPYSQARYATSEISTLRFPVSPTRRSSAGTGLAIDTSVCPEIERQKRRAAQIAAEHGRDSNARRLDSSTPKSRKHLAPRAMHRHTSSQDSTASNGLAALGSSLYNALRRVATPKQVQQGHTRAERYAFLRRTNAKVNGPDTKGDDHDERVHAFADDQEISTPPKSPRFRSIFTRSIWHRGTGHEEDLVCRPRIQDDCDGITLDSGFDCIDIDDGTDDTWLGNIGGGHEELESALQRDVNRLKSTFSWTTTSTSRYIDVAAYLEDDSDTDSTVSSLGAPIAPTASHFGTRQAKTTITHALDKGCNSPWLPIEPPTPRPGFKFPQNSKPQRNVLRKTSKTQVACLPSEEVLYAPEVAKVGQDQHRYQACSKCQLQVELCEFEAQEHCANQRKGKGRANSQPDPPDSIRNTVCLGRPAPLRSSSTPASFTHTRSQSLPGSQTATPAEVLARASYNHEWATPVPSRHISHARSPSAPQQSSSLSTMSMKRPITPTRSCQHFSDMRDILRGVQSGIRPSTPIPGMPPAPKNRPPPTSFRPVSAGGRERGRTGTPTSSASQPLGSWSQTSSLGRSRSHRPLASVQGPPSLRSRTRSLESLRGTAQALAAASTAPLRSLWRARSFMRVSQSDQARPSQTDDGDNVWVCVDIKSPSYKPKTTSPSEGTNAVAGPSGPSAFVFTSHPYRDATC